jgi:hypothetical protein
LSKNRSRHFSNSFATLTVLSDSVQRRGVPFGDPIHNLSITPEPRIVAVCVRDSSRWLAAIEPRQPDTRSSLSLYDARYHPIVPGHVVSSHQLGRKQPLLLSRTYIRHPEFTWALPWSDAASDTKTQLPSISGEQRIVGEPLN